MKIYATVTLALTVLSTVGCASKDAAYESAMRDWADKGCRCPAGDTTCWDDWRKTTPEPAFPEHFLDAAVDNPNHEIASKYSDQIRACGTRK